MSLIKVKSRGQESFGGRRNLIINGAMQVAQRGTSATGVGTAVSYNTVDRFRFADAGSPTARFTETQDSSGPVGFSNSIKFEVTTADTSVAATTHQYIDQFIEAQNLQHLAWGTSSGKKIVLSFYVKCSTAQTFAVDFVNEDNSKYFNTTYTVNAANTWERKIIVLPADTASGFNDDNGRGLRCRWTLVAGTDYTDGSVDTTWQSSNDRATNHQNTWVGATGRTWAMTGAQLEVGEQATDFEHRSVAEELELCKRYFQKFGGGAGKTIAHVYAPSTSELALMFRFAPEMRTTPSVDWSSDTTDLTYRYNSNNSQNFDRSNLNSDGSLGQVTPQGGAMWIAGWSHGQSSGDGGEVRVLGVTPEEFLFIQFDSEL